MRTGLLAVCLAMSATAHAEGTSTLGATQKLRSGVELYVDIVDSSVERITWTGVGNVAVTGPLGAVYGNYSSGQTIVPASGNGAYKLVPQSNQSESVPWEITVDNQTTAGGRLWSYTWQFNNGSFAPSHSTFASYYAVVPAGGSGETTVIELELEGLSGYWFDVAANRIGVTGEEGGKSVPMSGNSVWPEFPIYLAPPTNATYSRVNPMAEGFWLNGGGSTSVLDGSMIECNQFDPGVSGLAFYFETDVDGTFNVQCDLDQDGQYERTDSIDLLLIGTSEPGWNTVPWSGNDNDGNPVAEGTYNCRLQVNVGEFHYVGTDIESSYEGMRLFEVGSGGTRSPLTMYWDDSLVQYKAQNMPNGAVGLESSGNSGVSPGSYFAATVPNVNARSWGNFNSGGKGNESYLDTYTFAGSTVGVVITMEAVDGTVDTDGDGISDYEEACWYGTDPNESDSDGNGTPDGSQYGAGASSGGGGGLESNGRLQQALARRDLQRSFRAPVLAMRPPPSDLDGLVPWEGPRGSTPYEVSPYDLTQYTNAETVRAWDFVDPDGETVGAVMVFETTGEIYEHTKAICDRSGGSEVLGVTERSLGKGAYVTASYANAADNTHEHGTTVMLYDQGTVEREGETVDLGYLATSRWLMAEYPRPQADQKVLELQVWTASPRDQAGLLDAVLEAIGETRPIAWQDATRAPEAWFRAASTMGGALELDVANPLDLDYRLLATFTDERGVHSKHPGAAGHRRPRPAPALPGRHGRPARRRPGARQGLALGRHLGADARRSIRRRDRRTRLLEHRLHRRARRRGRDPAPLRGAAAVRLRHARRRGRQLRRCGPPPRRRRGRRPRLGRRRLLPAERPRRVLLRRVPRGSGLRTGRSCARGRLGLRRPRRPDLVRRRRPARGHPPGRRHLGGSRSLRADGRWPVLHRRAHLVARGRAGGGGPARMPVRAGLDGRLRAAGAARAATTSGLSRRSSWRGPRSTGGPPRASTRRSLHRSSHGLTSPPRRVVDSPPAPSASVMDPFGCCRASMATMASSAACAGTDPKARNPVILRSAGRLAPVPTDPSARAASALSFGCPRMSRNWSNTRSVSALGHDPSRSIQDINAWPRTKSIS